MLAFNLMGDGLRDALDPKLQDAHDGRPTHGRLLLEIEGPDASNSAPRRAPFVAVDGVDLAIDAGEIVGMRRRIGLRQERHRAGADGADRLSRARARASGMTFAGHDLLRRCRDAQRRALIGKDIAMIFQDPLASLNPCFTVAFQLMETLRYGTDESAAARRRAAARALELLRAGRDSRRRSAARRVSAPALRRHGAARDDRDGDRRATRSC